ncbi:Rrf2 family transcriptional regulator [Fodinisporobacter ferrooxydans]|uniref:Rrf2 family transcriptional regulator n=1 Tax=Fodinisporobacter ferrooxydans TaxID=2901836 RepID=A0ABY4CMB4_9BACL|nr:Rrf2 family transcriptional regulator [Alicyclobacillaceae bacterium MYW30-H2]
MKVSNRTEYGLRALVCLAKLSNGSPVPLRVIAENEDISEQFLDQIFLTLRRAQLVRSIRGANGGYMLEREPKDITMGEVVRTLEGSISPMACATEDMPENFCSRSQFCDTRSVWAKLAESMARALDGISLADVLNDTQGPKAARNFENELPIIIQE